jgi:hypothetical protein
LIFYCPNQFTGLLSISTDRHAQLHALRFPPDASWRRNNATTRLLVLRVSQEMFDFAYEVCHSGLRLILHDFRKPNIWASRNVLVRVDFIRYRHAPRGDFVTFSSGHTTMLSTGFEIYSRKNSASDTFWCWLITSRILRRQWE